ncbi:MAG: hypothetical protein NVS3B21_18650 [Acidimicrobiales bacterium]
MVCGGINGTNDFPEPALLAADRSRHAWTAWSPYLMALTIVPIAAMSAGGSSVPDDRSSDRQRQRAKRVRAGRDLGLAAGGLARTGGSLGRLQRSHDRRSKIMTLCQEHCPIGTAAFVQTMRDYRATAADPSRVVFLSVTIDPTRDTPAQLPGCRALYVGNRPLPQWRLLTGSSSGIVKLWKFFHVYVQRVKETGSRAQLAHGPGVDL